MTNRATLLILDRTFDLSGPLMHEYSYWNFIQEFLDGDVTTLMNDKEKATFCFNQEDPLWQLYKTANIDFTQLDLKEKLNQYL